MDTHPEDILLVAANAYETVYNDAISGSSQPMNPDVVAEAKRAAAQAVLAMYAPPGSVAYAYHGRRGVRMGIALANSPLGRLAASKSGLDDVTGQITQGGDE